MKRTSGSVITAIGFWLILISILSIPNSVQDALVIASAIGLIILSFSVGPKKAQFAFPSRKQKAESKHQPEKQPVPPTPEPPQPKTPPTPEVQDTPDVVVSKPQKPPTSEPAVETKKAKENEDDIIHNYRDQGVNVTLRNDL